MVETNPSVKAYFDLGMSHYNRGDYLRASEQWKLAINQDPTYAAAHRYLALAYEKLKWNHKAKKQWETYLKVETNEVAKAQIIERMKAL
jgi:Tfp pilus assembly protein PilF